MHDNYSSAFKAKVALLALRDKKLIGELCIEFDLDPTLIYLWRSQLIDEAPSIFEAIATHIPKKESTTAKAIRELIRRD